MPSRFFPSLNLDEEVQSMKPSSPGFTPVFLILGMATLSLLPVQLHAETINITGDGSSVPFRFDPANATVKPGDKITWVNQTKVEHSVTPDAGFQKKLKGKDIEASESYSAAIKTGPIKYHCKYHPNMKAMIAVAK
jgi:plastocyanin